MMNPRQILYFILLILLFAGCKKDDDLRKKDDLIISEYLSQHGLTAQKTESGLYYIIDVPGVFPRPTINSTITVHYKGYLTNQKVFDTTEGDEPATFKLSEVIEGWQEGMQLYGEGGKGTLLIPSYMGYGSAILPGIPANSVLIFDIHLIDVE